MFVAENGRIKGMICVADTIKESSAGAVDEMKAMGMEVYMLTGDNRRTAEYIGAQAHVDHVIAEVLPGDKVQEVLRLQKEGKRVMMVGADEIRSGGCGQSYPLKQSYHPKYQAESFLGILF